MHTPVRGCLDLVPFELKLSLIQARISAFKPLLPNKIRLTAPGCNRARARFRRSEVPNFAETELAWFACSFRSSGVYTAAQARSENRSRRCSAGDNSSLPLARPFKITLESKA
jgi:hypothetical protein